MVVKMPNQSRVYDIIVSRATAYMPEILTWAEPFLAKNGRIILYKTPSEEELVDAQKALAKLRLKIVKTHDYLLE